MGRRAREKKARKQGASRSGLSNHRQEGKLLMPPLSGIPNLQQISWMNDRLPELIWAALLAVQLPRETLIEMFRSIAGRIQRAGEGAPYDLRLTGLVMALPASRELIIDFVCGPAKAKEALSSLLLFPNLPGREVWLQAISRAPGDAAWPTLATAVAQTLDHQSQTATDLRWGVLLCMLAAGQLLFPKQLEHIPKELALYPYLGDQRKVRPTIRASEGLIATLSSKDSQSAWAPLFWGYCLNATPCFPLPIKSNTLHSQSGTTVSQMSIVTEALLRHCARTCRTSAIDPRYDTVFGMALYSVAILSELIRIGASTQISARFGLRALLEIYITLAYLLVRDDPNLWRSYRVYGSGQAKLAALKLDEAVGQPLSISNEQLREIANEDVWEEFLNIDLGHWANANLRQLSVDAGVKGDYDRFYSWTSMYIHGHWGAVRSAVFDTCGNPLHRLHRIPRLSPQGQPDVILDAVELVDKTLALVDRAYPPFVERLKV